MVSRIVIIGAGECSVRCAFALREAGFAGEVTLIGEEEALPYERPPLSKNCPLAERAIAGEDAYRTAGISLRRGLRVEEIDRTRSRLRLAGGESVLYDRLLIATGARARSWPGGGGVTLRTLEDARALLTALAGAARLAIIGGGFIGLELAATARGMGIDVVIVEAADRLMARAVPAQIARIAEARHRDAGIDIRLGTGVAGIGPAHVALEDGTRIEADIIVAGIGSVPNVELAQRAGLTIENGIRVDQRLRTDDPAIFAAGDCCNFPRAGARVRLESWRAARDQAEHAAKAMLGEEAPYAAVPWFWSDQHDLTLQVAGLAAPDRPFIRREADGGAVILFQLAPDGTLAAASGIGPGNAVARDIRLAEMLIGRGIAPPPAALADPSFSLKSLLRG